MSKLHEAILSYEHEDLEERIRARQAYTRKLFLPIFGEADELTVDWLVENLIPQGYLCLLAGGPKSGKTSLATAIALAVATGTNFAGRKTAQGSVLWIAAEESYFERRVILAGSPLVDDSVPLYTCYERLNIDDDAALESIATWIRDTEAKLLVVDPSSPASAAAS